LLDIKGVFEKILQKFNINGDTKFVNILLASHFKLKATISPTTVGSLMYAMVCTRPDLS